jgi:hypothetical protein
MGRGGRSLIRSTGTFAREEKGSNREIPAAQNWQEIAENCAAGILIFVMDLRWAAH